MRNQTINGVKLTYPDERIFLWDENNLVIEGGSGTKIGYNLALTNAGTYEVRSLSYRSGFSNKITVPLTEVIRSLYNDSTTPGGYCGISGTLQVFQDGVSMGWWTWYTVCMEGRTMSYKQHGGNKIIHIYSQDELQNVQIYSPEVATLYLGVTPFYVFKGINTLNLSAHITTPGVYNLCFTEESPAAAVTLYSVTNITPSSAVINLQYQTSSSSGDSGETHIPNIYRGDDLRDCYFLVYGQDMTWNNGQICESTSRDGDFIELRYRDTDGSRRYLGGRIMSDELEYEGLRYNRVDPMMLFKKPLRYVQSHVTNLTIGLADLERASGFDEILLSSLVEMRCAATNGEWVPCIIEDPIVRNGGEDRYDVELQIKVS